MRKTWDRFLSVIDALDRWQTVQALLGGLGAGGVLASVARALLNLPFWWLVLLFAGVSLIAFVALARRFAKNRHESKAPVVPSALDRIGILSVRSKGSISQPKIKGMGVGIWQEDSEHHIEDPDIS